MREEDCDIPFSNLITPNSTITIPSIFMFEDVANFYAFRYLAEKSNCEVYLKNEDILLKPNDRLETDVILLAYTAIIANRKIGDDYIRYLSNESLNNVINQIKTENRKESIG